MRAAMSAPPSSRLIPGAGIHIYYIMLINVPVGLYFCITISINFGTSISKVLPGKIIIIIIIMLVYYSCSHNATTEPTSVTQDSTDTIQRKASI